MKLIHKHTTVLLLIAYFVTHLVGLVQLPVFADEAIYIRWSQLMIDDFSRYAFFPLNDGKPPLQMWLMIPLLKIFADPLWAGRFLSVLAGAVQLFVIGQLVKASGGGKRAQFIAQLLTIFLPFWFFHHRMALIDGLFTLFISTTLLGLIKLAELKEKKITFHTAFLPIIVAGVSFGLALLTKLPALFLSVSFPLFAFVQRERMSQKFRRIMAVAVAGALGLAIFFSLKLHPAFGQLFGRGNDFTFTIQEIVAGEWRTSLSNIPRVLSWIVAYISWPILVLSLLAPFFLQKKRSVVLLLLSGLIFAGPFVVLGRVIAPRYFVPLAPIFTVLAALTLERFLSAKNQLRWLGWGVIAWVSIFSLRWLFFSYLNSNQLPFPPVDRMQYLEEWSSGHGMQESVAIIDEFAKQGRVYVATEGLFGTLPDALNMYFHTRDVSNIKIEGIGAPVFNLPEQFFTESEQADTTLLIVNSSRMHVNNPFLYKIAKFPRPNNAPMLEIYQYVPENN